MLLVVIFILHKLVHKIYSILFYYVFFSAIILLDACFSSHLCCLTVLILSVIVIVALHPINLGWQSKFCYKFSVIITNFNYLIMLINSALF